MYQNVQKSSRKSAHSLFLEGDNAENRLNNCVMCLILKGLRRKLAVFLRYPYRTEISPLRSK